jgi:hypothetical protein
LNSSLFPMKTMVFRCFGAIFDVRKIKSNVDKNRIEIYQSKSISEHVNART